MLARVDFDVPLAADGTVAEDRRIRAALPTLRHAALHGARTVVMSHIGRPRGRYDRGLSLAAAGRRLSELLPEGSVATTEDTVGDRARRTADLLAPGQILVLENLRFDPREDLEDPGLAGELRRCGDVYVEDGFSIAHQCYTSTCELPKQFPAGRRVAGLLVDREITALDAVLDGPPQPVVLAIGGVKTAEKLGVIAALADRADRVIVGGAMAHAFLVARGDPVGESLVAPGTRTDARALLERLGDRLELPRDHRVAPAPELAHEAEVVAEIPDDRQALDIGPATLARYREVLRGAGTVIWNGPMGVFEQAPFHEGTMGIARTLAELPITTVVGGGETSQVIENLGLEDRLTHVSTGGRAFLEYLRRGTLPALDVLDPA